MNYIIYSNDNADINAAYKKLKKSYPTVKMGRTSIDIDEMLEDEYLLALSLERKKNDNGVRISFEEHLAKRGLTVEDVDRMLEEEDVELEYELPG